MVLGRCLLDTHLLESVTAWTDGPGKVSTWYSPTGVCHSLNWWSRVGVYWIPTYWSLPQLVLMVPGRCLSDILHRFLPHCPQAWSLLPFLCLSWNKIKHKKTQYNTVQKKWLSNKWKIMMSITIIKTLTRESRPRFDPSTKSSNKHSGWGQDVFSMDIDLTLKLMCWP